MTKRIERKTHGKVLSTILTVLVVLGVAGAAVFFYIFGDMQQGEALSPDDSSLGIVEVPQTEYDIVNIALFGVDTRNENSFSGLSDTMIIVSINRTTKEVKMVSILRDSLVKVRSSYRRVNEAYAYGGATLAINTLNTNFKLDIEDYATINFARFKDIIKVLGGVNIELDDDEVDYMNKVMHYTASSPRYFSQPGVYLLSASEALQYSRIRKIDSDAYRAGRQREVLEAMLKQFRNLPVTKMPEVLKTILASVETSMSYAQLINYMPLALDEGLTIDSIVIPNAMGYGNFSSAGSLNDTPYWHWEFDTNLAAKVIRTYLYGTN